MASETPLPGKGVTESVLLADEVMSSDPEPGSVLAQITRAFTQREPGHLPHPAKPILEAGNALVHLTGTAGRVG